MVMQEDLTVTHDDPIAAPSEAPGHQSATMTSRRLSPEVFGAAVAVEPIIRLVDVSIWYGLFRAVRGFSARSRPIG